jgi:hypothetical protein
VSYPVHTTLDLDLQLTMGRLSGLSSRYLSARDSPFVTSSRTPTTQVRLQPLSWIQEQ